MIDHTTNKVNRQILDLEGEAKSPYKWCKRAKQPMNTPNNFIEEQTQKTINLWKDVQTHW